ncbi:hypothetical protein G3545_05845 [Starkeya sp. ORNL1]|uniref:hypothetical protein n=1 Tax=Starkeya sp. ORNL1 TaxID=2709380 RepID=UPI0014637443|nr:hypothetical protein [Starkeya sp. ORNL1]QJP13212.1 hypothetical protein G3545_05845 [Starkeya sp. ORNL1]
MRETTRTIESAREQERRALRSTGDARVIPGRRQPKQTVQPSLGDPENAPGHPADRPDAPRD